MIVEAVAACRPARRLADQLGVDPHDLCTPRQLTSLLWTIRDVPDPRAPHLVTHAWPLLLNLVACALPCAARSVRCVIRRACGQGAGAFAASEVPRRLFGPDAKRPPLLLREGGTAFTLSLPTPTACTDAARSTLPAKNDHPFFARLDALDRDEHTSNAITVHRAEETDRGCHEIRTAGVPPCPGPDPLPARHPGPAHRGTTPAERTGRPSPSPKWSSPPHRLRPPSPRPWAAAHVISAPRWPSAL